MLSKQRTKTKHTVPRLNFYYGNLFLICNSIHTDRLAFMTSVSLALTLPFPSHWALPETVTHVATAVVTSKVKFEKKITGKVKTDKNFEFLQQWVNIQVTNLEKRTSRHRGRKGQQRLTNGFWKPSERVDGLPAVSPSRSDLSTLPPIFRGIDVRPNTLCQSRGFSQEPRYVLCISFVG